MLVGFGPHLHLNLVNLHSSACESLLLVFFLKENKQLKQVGGRGGEARKQNCDMARSSSFMSKSGLQDASNCRSDAPVIFSPRKSGSTSGRREIEESRQRFTTYSRSSFGIRCKRIDFSCLLRAGVQMKTGTREVDAMACAQNANFANRFLKLKTNI